MCAIEIGGVEGKREGGEQGEERRKEVGETMERERWTQRREEERAMRKVKISAEPLPPLSLLFAVRWFKRQKKR